MKTVRQYGTRESKCQGSVCCYMDGYGIQVAKSELEKLIDAVKNRPQNFLPEYLPKIKKIINEECFVRFQENRVILKGDKSRKPIVICMTDYYPCFFLENSSETSCMIYPYGFQRCKNTPCEDCINVS